MNRPLVLVIDGDSEHRRSVRQALDIYFDCVEADTLVDAKAIFDARKPQAMITNFVLPCVRGVETIYALQQIAPDVPIVAIVSEVNEALDAIIAGAQDGIVKNAAEAYRLPRVVMSSIARHHVRGVFQPIRELLDENDKLVSKQFAIEGRMPPPPTTRKDDTVILKK